MCFASATGSEKALVHIPLCEHSLVLFSRDGVGRQANGGQPVRFFDKYKASAVNVVDDKKNGKGALTLCGVFCYKSVRVHYGNSKRGSS